MKDYRFFVAGEPAAQGSMKVVRPRNSHRVKVIHDQPKKLKAWRSIVATEALVRRPANWSLEGAIEITAQFYLRRPKRTPSDAPTGTPDLDKLLRAVGDALTSIAFHDDSQVVAWAGSKQYVADGERAGVRLTIARGFNG